jgi:hypothetical protein
MEPLVSLSLNWHSGLPKLQLTERKVCKQISVTWFLSCLVYFWTYFLVPLSVGTHNATRRCAGPRGSVNTSRRSHCLRFPCKILKLLLGLEPEWTLRFVCGVQFVYSWNLIPGDFFCLRPTSIFRPLTPAPSPRPHLPHHTANNQISTLLQPKVKQVTSGTKTAGTFQVTCHNPAGNHILN